MKWGLLTASLLLALVACGGGDDAEPTTSPSASDSSERTTPTPATDEGDLERAYRAYVGAFLTGDGATAYELLSDRCREQQPLSEFAAIAESAAEIYGEVDYTINDVTVEGDEGRVDAEFAVDALNSGGGSLWVLEEGGWRTDKCD